MEGIYSSLAADQWRSDLRIVFLETTRDLFGLA